MALTRPKYSQIYDTDYKQSVRLATTGADVGNLLLTGSITNTVDSITVAVDDRILVKNQSDATQNGIYRVVTVGTGSNGTWVRAHDADASDKVTSGLTTTISAGVINAYSTWKLATEDPITINTTELTFVNPFLSAALVGGSDKMVQFNDIGVVNGVAGLTYNKVAGIFTTGNILATGNLVVNGPILPAGNLTFTSTTQRITGDMTNVTLSYRLAIQTSVVNANTTIGILPNGDGTSGTVSTTNNSDPTNSSAFNLTCSATAAELRSDRNGSGTYLPLAVYTSDTERLSVDVGGNLLIGTNTSTSYSNVTIGHTTPSTSTTTGALVVKGGIGVSGNINAGNVLATQLTGTLLTASQTNITSVGNLTSLSASGTIQTTGIVYGNSGVSGTILTASQTNITSVGNLTSLSASGTIQTTGIVYGNSGVSGTILTASQTNITSVGNLTSLSASGVIQTTGIVYGNSGVSGTILTASQTNITSVGNLTSLSASGVIQTTGAIFANSGIASTSTTTGALEVIGGVGVTGNINAARLDLAGGSLTGTFGDQIRLGTLTTATSNVDTLEITKTRTSAGADWPTSAYRLQQKIDGTWMGYVQFNGTSTNAGLSFGTGSTTTNAVSITDSIRIDSTGVLVVGIKNQTVAIQNGGTAGTGNIGASGQGFNTIFAKATSAQYADLAENYLADFNYDPGTVLEFGGEFEVTECNTVGSTSVAGVISTNPAHLMNAELKGNNIVALALTGRVPTKVQGTVRKGDLMVSAGNGCARSEDNPRVGTIIGKALENFDGHYGVIEVVVGKH